MFLTDLVRGLKRGGHMSKDVLLKFAIAALKLILVVIQLLVSLG